MAKVRVGHNSGQGFKAHSTVDASKRGYAFQFRWTKRLMDKLTGFRTVTVRNGRGDLITADNLQRMGPDGGLDVIIEIEAKSEAACRQIAGKVRRAIEKM